MKHLSLSLVFVSFLVLTGCDPITGQLQVLKTFNASVDAPTCTDTDPRPECIGPIPTPRIEAGKYNAEFTFTSESQVTMTLKKDRWTSTQLNFNVPEGRRLPSYSGPISLSRHESGQPFDVKGVIHTVEHDSEQHSGYESCTYTVRERECDHRGRERGCRDVTRTVHGTQWVEYHYHYTDTDLALQFLSSSSTLAKFAGERHSVDKVYDHQGECR